jgi:hypothetical protein
MSEAQAYTPAGGPRLAEFLDSLPIFMRWISGCHVVWQTGQQNAPQGMGPSDHTHCSAFCAAVAQMLDIYLLRPPHHGQELLANAQADWLAGLGNFPGPAAAASGWTKLGSSGDTGALDAATAAAASGQLVLATYKAPPVVDSGGVTHQRPGHVCIVRPPAAQPVDSAGGPDVLSVGTVNTFVASMRTAFADHEGAWPSAIQLYGHSTALQEDFVGTA